jgi:2',3'-cyclic-nucleotide 2'-phosphodiesterase (5'-nucleotidase family)
LTDRSPCLLALVLVLTLAASGVSCGAPTPALIMTPTPLLPATPTPRPIALTIAHTNDVAGYLEPCG